MQGQRRVPQQEARLRGVDCVHVHNAVPQGQKVVFKSLTNYTKTANTKCLIAPLRTMMASKS